MSKIDPSNKPYPSESPKNKVRSEMPKLNPPGANDLPEKSGVGEAKPGTIDPMQVLPTLLGSYALTDNEQGEWMSALLQSLGEKSTSDEVKQLCKDLAGKVANRVPEGPPSKLRSTKARIERIEKQTEETLLQFADQFLAGFRHVGGSDG